MTEEQWLTSTDARPMVAYLNGPAPIGRPPHARPRREATGATDRKLLLFVAAVEREWWGGQIGPYGREPIELMEGLADGTIPRESPTLERMKFSYTLRDSAIDCATDCVRFHNSTGDPPRWANLLREILGNPFRRFMASTRWNVVHKSSGIPMAFLTPTVLSIARRVYDLRDWEGMPILADALEEAGCDDERILRHCRGFEAGCGRCEGDGKAHGSDRPFEWGPDPMYMKCPVCKGSRIGTYWLPIRGHHVRGCHVLDLILGKS